MGLKTNIADFKRGFQDATKDADDLWRPGPPTAASDKLLAAVSRALRVVLFGYLLALPGVPFLPWGRPGLIALVVAAWVAGSIPMAESDNFDIIRLVGASALMALSSFSLHSPSLVLIGVLVAAVAAAAQHKPFIYGVIVGVVGFALAAQLAGWHGHSDRLLFSGRPWTASGASSEMLHFAALLFIAGLMHMSGNEIARLHDRAKAAEHARAEAVADERARIARELHDVVSHHVTAMTLQAEAAGMTGDKDALAAVATEGRVALTELRRMLGVLRHPDDSGSSALAPQPTLGDLDDLAARASSGPTVRIVRNGTVRDLPTGVELGVYRLVQEALTNAAKHGDASTVDVVLSYAPGELTVDVTDNGRPLSGARVSSGGLGLVGMSERVALLNGILETGPRTDAAGYGVHAVIPLD